MFLSILSLNPHFHLPHIDKTRKTFAKDIEQSRLTARAFGSSPKPFSPSSASPIVFTPIRSIIFTKRNMGSKGPRIEDEGQGYIVETPICQGKILEVINVETHETLAPYLGRQEKLGRKLLFQSHGCWTQAFNQEKMNMAQTQLTKRTRQILVFIQVDFWRIILETLLFTCHEISIDEERKHEGSEMEAHTEIAVEAVPRFSFYASIVSTEEETIASNFKALGYIIIGYCLLTPSFQNAQPVIRKAYTKRVHMKTRDRQTGSEAAEYSQTTEFIYQTTRKKCFIAMLEL
ncbi:hypothetical protein CPB84DRAFT_1820883 [Gymnopilus junonius]|uniref:Uncharacterized protein n=1 Tax=Gymnopilus junonius TaxID=109634 RepID=A0A9P5NX85_GYMJU|nr:hypothetical protein CPB84DRAFT_1820883 [Gymnopilus junonius]